MEMQAEREGLAREGFASQEVVRRQPKRMWYRSDGSEIGELPVDPYHEARFRAKGWVLSPSQAVGKREKHFLGFVETPNPELVGEEK